MSIRKTVRLVIVCFLLTSLGAFCQTKEVSDQASRTLAALVKMKPSLKLDAKVTQALVNRIIEDNAFLAKCFAEEDFLEMANLLGKRGASLLSHNYQKVWGKHSAQYWKDSWKNGAVLNAVPVNIWVTDVVGRQPVKEYLPDEGKILPVTYDLAAVVVVEFHVIEPAPAKGNATSLCALVYRHQDTCVWE